MAEISLNEDSFCSWHTCPENSKSSQTSNENIIKDLNLDLDYDSEADSISEFEKIIDQSNPFSKFKENSSTEGFLRPVTPSSSVRKENSPVLLPNLVRPKYINDHQQQTQQNRSLADKTSPANNVYVNMVETVQDVPILKINNEKISNPLSVANTKLKKNISSVNQSSSVTLVDTDNQDLTISMPGGNLSIFENSNSTVDKAKETMKETKEKVKKDTKELKENIKDKTDDLKNNLKDAKDNAKDRLDEVKEEIKGKTEDAIEKDKNENENAPGAFGRLFNYFKGFGRSDNNDTTEEETNKENVEVSKKSNETKTLIETVESGAHQLQLPVPPAVLSTESSSLTVVNEEEKEEEDDDDFVNALDGQPVENVNVVNSSSEVKTKAKNKTNKGFSGQEIVVEETIVIQNPDGTETTTKKVITTYQPDSESEEEHQTQEEIKNEYQYQNQYQIQNQIQNQIKNQIKVQHPYQQSLPVNHVYANKVNTYTPVVPTLPSEAVIEDDQSTASSDEFVDAITASRSNINLSDENQFVSNIPPMGLPTREGTVKVVKNTEKIIGKQDTSSTLKASRPLNVELVPVSHNKATEADVTELRHETYQSLAENHQYSTSSRPARRTQKKEKKRKWYHKIFRFSICTRHEID